ncbi:MAG: GDSL-type esterase/lipase family protein [Sedimentisphaerales bacterium]
MLDMMLAGSMILLACCSKSAVNSCAVYSQKNAAVIPVMKAEKESYYFMPRHQAILQRIKQGNVNIVFIGDSIMRGWEDVGLQVWDKYYSPRGAVNMGFGGDRTQHVLWRLDNGEIDGISPRLAVVLIGINNIADNNAEEIAEGIRAICCRLRTKLPHTRILLLGIFPCGSLELKDAQKISRTNKIIARLSDNHMTYFLDIGTKFLDKNGKIPKEIMPDQLHPNLRGYELWAQAIEPEIVKLMQDE